MVSLVALNCDKARYLVASLFFLSLDKFYVMLMGLSSRAFMLRIEEIFYAYIFCYIRRKTSCRDRYFSASCVVNF